MNETLEAMAQALFQAWFVDFEPVKARQAAVRLGRDPERAAMAALSGKLRVPVDPEDLTDDALAAAEAALDALSATQRHRLAQTAALFPDRLVESELGLIPEGWGVSKIGKETHVLGGATPRTKNPVYWEGGTFYWATPKDLSNLTDKVLLTTSRRITKKGVDKISSGQLPVGTVLMSSRAPVGYLVISQVPISINQGFIAMVCDKSLSNYYVIQWLHHNMDEIKQRAGGSTFAEISKRNFRPIQCLVPAPDAMTAFSAYVGDLYSKITTNARESITLAELRDTLLPRLLSGELSVEAAQETVEALS